MKTKIAVTALCIVQFTWAEESSKQIKDLGFLWEEKLDAEIIYRSYNNLFGNGENAEPDVGISEEKRIKNPITLVTTVNSIYVFEEGNLKRRIKLRWDKTPEESVVRPYVDTTLYVRTLGAADPKGKFYLIKTDVTKGWDGWNRANISVYNLDGSLRFQIEPKRIGDQFIPIAHEINISPDGKILTAFYDGKYLSPFPHLTIYDTFSGNFSHLSRKDFERKEFSPYNLTFSEARSFLILEGVNKKSSRKTIRPFDLWWLNGHGDTIKKSKGEESTWREELKIKNMEKRTIIKKLIEKKGREKIPSLAIQDILISKDRNMGVYIIGSTITLFEIDYGD